MISRTARAFLRFLGSEKQYWPVWWKGLSPRRKLLPIVLMVLYFAALYAVHGLRDDHFYTALLILALAYGGRAAGTFLRLLLPVYLTGVIYDSQRHYSDYIRGEIHVAWPYLTEKRLFGIETAEFGRLTPNEYWQRHIHPVLDVICGFFYLFFIAIYVSISIFHALILPRLQEDPITRARNERLGPYVTWAFFWVNMLGYSTYYWFAAAPPWYVAKYGLGPADLSAPASAAGCLRFDQVLGTHFFTEMYGRSADVFGAIPSLHVSYPFLSFLFALRFKSLRVFSLSFYLIMCFSAVYLNHHYLIDIIWGTTYATLVWIALFRYAEWKSDQRLARRLA